MKKTLVMVTSLPWQIKNMIRLGCFLGNHVPVAGKLLSMIVDRIILLLFALDVSSRNVFVRDFRIPHPIGVLLGGNGIRSNGRVLVNAGVKFVARSPDDPLYLKRHAEKSVFRLGDKVMIGTNSVLIGPLDICDDVVIGAMSTVTKDITESGTYVGSPVRRISDSNAGAWF